MTGSGKSEARSSDKPGAAGKKKDALLREIEELRARLEEAEATVQAIQTGEVDALIISGPDGEKVFALEGADYPYRVIVDVMNEGVVTLSADGFILYCNNRFADFVKLPGEQILGKPLTGFVSKRDKPKLSAFLDETAQRSNVVTVALSHEDGTTIPVNLSARAFEVGGFSAFCVVVTDLTETFAATETRLRLASIVETSNDAIISESLDNKILTWNTAAERIYGFSAQEVVGKPASLIVPPDRAQELEMIGKKIRVGQRIEGYETLRITKSGTPIHVSLTVSPLLDPNGNVTGFSIIARDIMERMKAEAELEKHRHHLEEMVQERTGELEAAERRIQALNDVLQGHVAAVNAANKELDSYGHSVSHDLRTPLRFVSRIAHMLLHEPGAGLSKNATQQINMILQATSEMSKLIENLLVFSQVGREAIRKRRVDMKRLFQEVAKELQHAEEHCGAEILIQDLTPCHGDRILLKEVAANLLENALKFAQRRDTAQITVGCTVTEAETVYYVQDNGVGFNMIDSDDLFLPFHRLHKPADFAGTGIGLALVKRIIERHGGRVWAAGETGKGSTFYFTLGEETAG